jgi:hypothetical protein
MITSAHYFLARLYAKRALKQELWDRGFKAREFDTATIELKARIYFTCHKAELLGLAAVEIELSPTWAYLKRSHSSKKPNTPRARPTAIKGEFRSG